MVVVVLVAMRVAGADCVNAVEVGLVILVSGSAGTMAVLGSWLEVEVLVAVAMVRGGPGDFSTMVVGGPGGFSIMVVGGGESTMDVVGAPPGEGPNDDCTLYNGLGRAVVVVKAETTVISPSSRRTGAGAGTKDEDAVGEAKLYGFG